MNEHLNGLAQKNAIGAVVVMVIRAIIVALGLALMVIAVPICFFVPAMSA